MMCKVVPEPYSVFAVKTNTCPTPLCLALLSKAPYVARFTHRVEKLRAGFPGWGNPQLSLENLVLKSSRKATTDMYLSLLTIYL